MPTVVWTQGANTLTFSNGLVRRPHRFDGARTLMDRLAGGSIATYEIGLGDLETFEVEFPHCDKTTRDNFRTWKDTIAKNQSVTFTHTDNSESPAYAPTVRLVDSEIVPEHSTDPTRPRFTIRVQLQVEPS